jgi:RHS repeat-associated protein
MTYDGANRVSAVTGTFNGQQMSYVGGVTYAAHGAPSFFTYGNQLALTLGYNSRLQLSSYQDALQNAPTSILFSVSANWGAANNNGSLQSETLYEGGPGTLNSLTQLNRSYGYDPINRVSAASDSGGWSRTFCYDRNGNLWVTGNSGVTLAGNTPQQLGGPCPSSTTPYNGNNQISGANYDAAGNQTVVNGNTLGYDAENRVASALDSVTQSTETYLYDGDGQRVEKSGPAGTTVYVYDVQGRLAAEYSTASSTSPCTTCYLSADQLGSTRLVTDFSGSVVGRHDYLPFGEEVSPNTLDNINQKFTGQMRDAETGMDFFHARYFGAALGRFTSPDPANAGADITNPQSWNAYSYVTNNPLALIDPSGLQLDNIGGYLFDTFSYAVDGEVQGTETQFLGCGFNFGDSNLGGLTDVGQGGGSSPPSIRESNTGHNDSNATQQNNGQTVVCQGPSEWTAVGPDQAPAGALGKPGHVPGGVAINPKIFGVTVGVKGATRSILNFAQNSALFPADISLNGFPPPPYTITDIGDQNVLNNIPFEFDLYGQFKGRPTLQQARNFGRQSTQTFIVVKKSNFTCPGGYKKVS